MKINCELPKCMLGDNTSLNDFDFVLFHLYQQDPDYKYYYNQLRKTNPDRTMIFDNSAYEFFIKGQTLDLKAFKEAIEELKPDFYILPDVLMDREKTMSGIVEFMNNYLPDCDAKPLAVAQGNNEQELVWCLEDYYEMGLRNIALPFHNSFFKDFKDYLKDDYAELWFLEQYCRKELTEDMKYAVGRVSFVNKYQIFLDTFDYVHILGSHCPLEKRFYDFDSMDTGYPVKLGYTGVYLGNEDKKPEVIIDDFFNETIYPMAREVIRTNIQLFKGY